MHDNRVSVIPQCSEKESCFCGYGSLLRWDPADDRCVAGEALLDNQPELKTWRLSGELIAVAQRTGSDRV